MSSDVACRCLWCTKMYTVPSYLAVKGIGTKYCSSKCFGAHRTSKAIKLANCHFCGKQYEVSRARRSNFKGHKHLNFYCSRTCSYKGQSFDGTRLLKCVECQKTIRVIKFHKNQEHCSHRCAMKSKRTRKKMSKSAVTHGLSFTPWYSRAQHYIRSVGLLRSNVSDELFLTFVEVLKATWKIKELSHGHKKDYRRNVFSSTERDCRIHQ